MGSFKLKQGLGAVFLPGIGRVVPGQVVTNEQAQRFVPQFLEEVVEEKKAEPVVAKVKEMKAPPAVIVPPPPPPEPEVKPAAKSQEPEPEATMSEGSRPTPPPAPAKEKEKKAKKKG